MPIKILSDLVDVVSEHISNPGTSGFEIFVGLEHYDSGDPVITRYGSTNNLASSVKHFVSGDILVARRNVYLRRAGVVRFEGVTSGDSIVLRVKDKEYSDILPFILNTDDFWDYAEQNSDGTMSKRLAPDVLLEYECNIPDNHYQIANKLWAAYHLKESYKRLLTATDEMVKSQFIEMFGNHSSTPVSDYIADSYPGEWGVEDKDGSGVKVIRTTNFTNAGKLDLTDVVTRSIIEKKVKRKTIKKFDTILERSGGTAENPVGRVVLFEEDDQYLCNNFTQVLRFKDIDPRYAFYSLFYYYQMNKTYVRSMGSKTTGIQNLDMNKYLEIGIPNASDDEQSLFIAITEQADKSKFELRKSIDAIDQVIKSLING